MHGIRRGLGGFVRRHALATTAAVLVLAGGGAYAATTGGGGDTIYACVNPTTGALIASSATAVCKGNKISWNSAGTAGPAGPTGPRGATGPQGPTGARGPSGGAAFLASTTGPWQVAATLAPPEYVALPLSGADPGVRVESTPTATVPFPGVEQIVPADITLDTMAVRFIFAQDQTVQGLSFRATLYVIAPGAGTAQRTALTCVTDPLNGPIANGRVAQGVCTTAPVTIAAGSSAFFVADAEATTGVVVSGRFSVGVSG